MLVQQTKKLCKHVSIYALAQIREIEYQWTPPAFGAQREDEVVLATSCGPDSAELSKTYGYASGAEYAKDKSVQEGNRPS